MWPVGSIFLNTDGKDPGIFLGGTWTLFAQGRTLIGVGAEGFIAAGATGGASTHTLTPAQIPSHSHTVNSRGSALASVDITLPMVEFITRTPVVFSPPEVVDRFTTNNTGGGEALDIMPPYITCYIWTRTA